MVFAMVNAVFKNIFGELGAYSVDFSAKKKLNRSMATLLSVN